MATLCDLRRAAREIFAEALDEVDAGRAVRRAVRFDKARLMISETSFDLATHPRQIYVISIGKAALPMAFALDEILGEKIRAGIIAGILTGHVIHTNAIAPSRDLSQSAHWKMFQCGHPLPDESSLLAAQASFELLRRANDERAFVIFLISGGGSAMIEWPRDEATTLTDLRAINQALVSSGASISEINAVRMHISAVKGGGLARRAPRADQVSLIVSDTSAGQESIVASGPTFDPPEDAPDPKSVIEQYKLAEHFPASILRAINEPSDPTKTASTRNAIRQHYVLLDNESACTAAAKAARRRGFHVEIARDILEQPVAEGCAQLVSRVFDKSPSADNKGFCLISGGEFACPVRGSGTGGRNAETILRCAIEIDERKKSARTVSEWTHVVALSAGTDGVDGNSPAAGAIADETTIERARALNLSAKSFLAASDAHSFFNALGDAIVTGPTGTNVRDLRIVLACQEDSLSTLSHQNIDSDIL